ncbi:MAG: hypothetical protein IKR17_04235 [Bacteroidales bacterium]|nr:hypothetical protein [Bacteroidales bacterium]
MNKFAMRRIIFIILFISSITANAQLLVSLYSRINTSVQVRVSASAATNEDIRPLWSYSNQWGLENVYDQLGANIYGKYAVRYNSFHAFELKHSSLWSTTLPQNQTVRQLFSATACVSGQFSTESLRTMIHEAYVAGNFWIIDYTIGLQAFTPIVTNNELSSGSFLMSNNARPIPRVGVGIFNYWSVPYTRNLVQLRGGVFFGLKTNEGVAEFSDNILFHEKFIYARLGTQHVKPYVGLVHSAMMGGTLPNGKKIPLDFWNSFLARNGDASKFTTDFERGETTNAAGAHQGMWDLGLNLDLGDYSAMLYYQRPFADNKAKKLFKRFYNNKDFTIGLNVNLPWRYLKMANFEFVKTDWQGGEGTPDPIFYDKNGVLCVIYPGDIDKNKWREWMQSHIADDVVAEYEAYIGREMEDYDDLFELFEHFYNRGLKYGGRTNYLSNAFYPQGWSTAYLSMGSAFAQTNYTVRKYADEQQLAFHTGFSIVCYRVLNFGVKGSLSSKVDYRFRCGFAKYYGNLIEKYGGNSFSWNKLEPYYFENPRKELHLNLNMAYKFEKYPLSLLLDVSGDAGDMYDSYSLRLGAQLDL